MLSSTLVAHHAPSHPSSSGEPRRATEIELSDDELEHVVGGLTRPWDGAPHSGLLPTLPLPAVAP